MSRAALITFLASAFLVAFTAVPPILPQATGLNLFGSAQAQKEPTTKATNLNSSKSNIYRQGTKKTGKGGPAGLAVSDEGAPGDKSTKGKKSSK